jgi:surfactin synthase thioesterase subunit
MSAVLLDRAPVGRSLRRYGGRRQPLLRLLCFPWCGAGASVYRRLAPSLPDHIELLVVQMPGREDRYGEAPLRSMAQMVQQVVEDVLPLFDRPLFLFGHSMGALAAYETARALKRHTGREPDGLIVSGHGAPWLRRPGTRPWHLAGEDDFIAHLRRLGGTPDAILNDRTTMRLLLPMLRADYEALDGYRHDTGEPLACPLLACAGDADPEVSRESMPEWRHATSGASALHWFEGDHFYLSAAPAAWSRCLQDWITGLRHAAPQPVLSAG